MTTSTRRKLGISLIALSVITFLVVDISLSHWHFAGGGSSGNVQWAAYDVDIGGRGHYLIPIILCGMIGVLYWVWPSRKPPKLPR
jgi:hypothetical protein